VGAKPPKVRTMFESRTRALAAAMLLAVLAGALLAPSAQAHGEESAVFEMAPVVFLPYAKAPVLTFEGLAGSGAYPPFGMWTDSDSGVSVEFLHDNASLYVSLRNPNPGWIALGLSSDLDQGMGFVVVGMVNGTVVAEERWAANASDEAVFTAPANSTGTAVQAANSSQVSGGLSADLRLALDTSLWSLEPGALYPTLVAYNTTSESFPSTIAGSEAHVLRSYVFRADDSPAEIQRLFAEDISPLPGFVAIGTITAGVAAITVTFARRRER